MSTSTELIPWNRAESEESDPSILRQGKPWRVTVDLNELCNIQCSYCHIDALWGPNAKDARTLPPAVVGGLLRDADAMHIFDVTLTGGEITTLSNLNEYMAGINDLRFTSTQIITNGTMLKGQLPGELKDAGLSRVSISIDGPQSSHDQARGERTWQRAWTGLENTLSAGLTANVISVLGRHNIDDWHKLSRRLKEVGVRSQNVSLMCRLGRAETADEWMGVPEHRLNEVRQKAREVQAELNDDTFFIYFNDGVTKPPGWSGEPTPLHAFQDQNPGIELVAKVDGSLLRNRLYGQGRAIGSLLRNSLTDLWRQDRALRTELSGVVGNENVGALPNLYYHYERAPDANTAATPTYSSQSGEGVRVREEPWGVSVFDPSIFAITGLYVRRPG